MRAGRDERIYVRSTLPVGTSATRTASRRAPTKYSSSPSRNRSRRRAGQRADMIQPSRVSRMIVTTLIVPTLAVPVDRLDGLRRRAESTARVRQAHRPSHPAGTLRVMPVTTLPAMIYRPSQTATANRGGCWTCASFHGERIAHGAHVVCRRGGHRQVQANPSSGCAFHQREPGAD